MDISSKNTRNFTTLLVCGCVIATLSLGVRHTFGLFLRPMTMDLNWGREAFSIAIALQNLVWGVAQPFSGWLADRYGAGRVVFCGGLLYALGVALMAHSSSPAEFSLSAGLLVGLGLSGTTFSVVFAAVGRAVSAERRPQALALVGAAGSFGQFAMVPLAQTLTDWAGWFQGLLTLALASALIAPLAAGAAERDRPAEALGSEQSAVGAMHEAFTQRSFVLLTLGFFVCGFQVVFIGVHLPAYLIDQGLAPNTGMLALAVIALFNIVGSYGFGVAAGHWRKTWLLAGIYFARGMIIAIFLALPITTVSVVVFSALMGLLWLSTVPLTNSVIAQVFGVRYLAMLSGFAFFSHQVGSFLGVWLGGLLYDQTGSYTVAWIVCIALGVLGALLNLPVDERPLRRAALAPVR